MKKEPLFIGDESLPNVNSWQHESTPWQRDYDDRHSMCSCPHLRASAQTCTYMQRYFTMVRLTGHSKFLYQGRTCQIFQFLKDIQFFPASPKKPEIAFDINLLHQCHPLFKSGATHATEFMGLLQDEHVKLMREKLVADLRPPFKHAYRQYAYIKTQVDIGNEDLWLPKKIVCPACIKNPTKTTSILMDGNFSAKKHKLPTDGAVNPLFQDIYFLPTPSSDQSAENNAKEECNMRAGKLLRQTYDCNLAVSGLFGAICKHQIPLSLVDITDGGERYGYAESILIDHQRKAWVDSNKTIFKYDIACNFTKYLANRAITVPACTGIPDFHVLGHERKCQIKYGRAFVEGNGLLVGETIETFWSLLRHCWARTKYMTSQNRRDEIILHLYHIAERHQRELPSRIIQQYNDAHKLRTVSQRQLDEIRLNYDGPQPLDDSRLHLLYQQREERFITGGKRRRLTVGAVSAPDNWKIDYAILLIRYAYHEERRDSSEPGETNYERQRSIIRGLDNKLRKVEKKEKLTTRIDINSETNRPLKDKAEYVLRQEIIEDIRLQFFEYNAARAARNRPNGIKIISSTFFFLF